jgi:hypothetical protein
VKVVPVVEDVEPLLLSLVTPLPRVVSTIW